MKLESLIDPVVSIAIKAGEQILHIYNQDDLGIEIKEDQSPLTMADKKSHECLMEGLSAISDLPILSEEDGGVDWATRQSWSSYWLLDPLDGTKEFIKRNGEFTVNIALIENGVAVFGVVYAPVLETLYYGAKGLGAFKSVGKKAQAQPISVSAVPSSDDTWRIVGSRSHQSDEFKAFVKVFPSKDIVSLGSSLKLCMVAEGAADLYPRLGLTSEWDTAAAQAVVESAGGQVLNWETKSSLMYNTKESLLNPFFIVCPKVSPLWIEC